MASGVRPSTVTSLAIGIGASVVVVTTLVVFRKRVQRGLASWVAEGQRENDWAQMPERIILLRHGEAEHNLEHGAILMHDHPNRKPDNLSELTETGRMQAITAGRRINELFPDRAVINVVVSPFERTQQTLYCLQSQLHNARVRCVRVDPRVREQEFGNWQVREEAKTHSKDASEIGRFWYRRPQGESGADVYDRADAFWDSVSNGNFSAARGQKPDDALLVVTHGLTMRLLLMRYYEWSPQTFDSVYNPGNCDMWVLKKVPGERRYAMEPEASVPPRLPWASRRVRLAMMGEGPWDVVTKDMTIVDYLSLRQPRTCQLEAALRLMIEGHDWQLDPNRAVGTAATAEARAAFMDSIEGKRTELDPDDVMSIDWWCGKISKPGMQLRADNNKTQRNLTMRFAREASKS
eukprot:TRINITY_DN80200_c0_g1_i1.p1 TRINITY_DN80200_c0_g1~~TRINITY_DN80200_c0_g1_i1.p1  ORF type:complete len:407 (-),score=40.60 TRINITY_DN80200_c0_g1_i1:137-1357(-)